MIMQAPRNIAWGHFRLNDFGFCFFRLSGVGVHPSRASAHCVPGADIIIGLSAYFFCFFPFPSYLSSPPIMGSLH